MANGTSFVLGQNTFFSHLAHLFWFPLVFLLSYTPFALLSELSFQNLDLTILPLLKPSETPCYLQDNIFPTWYPRCSMMVPKHTILSSTLSFLSHALYISQTVNSLSLNTLFSSQSLHMLGLLPGTLLPYFHTYMSSAYFSIYRSNSSLYYIVELIVPNQGLTICLDICQVVFSGTQRRQNNVLGISESPAPIIYQVFNKY